MERLPPVSGLGIDPVTRARRYDYSLTVDAPLYANSNFYPETMPLEIDVHEGIEVGVLLTGGQTRHHEGLVIPLGPGDAWLCGTWEPHGWQTTTPNSRDVVLIFLPEYLGEERLGDLPWLSLFAVPPSERPRVRTQGTREKVLALGREMLEELRAQRPEWQSVMRLDLLRLLLTLSRDWEPPARRFSQGRLRASNLPRIMPALVLVHTRPARRVTVADASATCGLSRAQFSRVFRNTMGMSFGRFCLQSRLGFVAQMLISSDLPTEQIAEQTSFADGSHLHRTFVKHFGCTPGTYRARARRAQAAPSAARGEEAYRVRARRSR
jgi:AraC-like DNA-binding protein